MHGEYRFFRGLLPFSIAGEEGYCGTFPNILYKRGAVEGPEMDRGVDDEQAHDDNADDYDAEQDDGNHVDLDDLDLIDQC